MRIFITGGTGSIGSRLIARLQERQDQIVVLTRRAAAARERLGAYCTIVEGEGMEAGPWLDAVPDCDAVINLAGESIFARRWNDDFMKLLWDTRIKTTTNLVQAMARNPRNASGGPKVLVNASAIGYYGPRGDEEISEESPPGSDALSRLTVAWEETALTARQHGIRTALIRIGVVLDKAGGALPKMLTPFKVGIGGPIGAGRHWFSWIHHQDVVGILMLALDNTDASGPMNGTAPNPVTNKEFSKALGRALHRPSFMPVPPFALFLRFGQVAEILTTGQRVLPRRALGLGYTFRFPDIDSALRDVLA